MTEREGKIHLRKVIVWLLPVLAAAILLCAIGLWKYCYIPFWVRWEKKEIRGNVFSASEQTTGDVLYSSNEDETSHQVFLSLSNRKVTVKDALGAELFTSDPGVRVQDALLADLNGDGSDEMLLLVWKRGLYGEHRPYWVEEESNAYSQHLFVYRMDRTGTYTPMWFSSEIGFDVCSMHSLEQNPSLLVLEDTEGSETVWRWTDFGPELVSP